MGESQEFCNVGCGGVRSKELRSCGLNIIRSARMCTFAGSFEALGKTCKGRQMRVVQGNPNQLTECVFNRKCVTYTWHTQVTWLRPQDNLALWDNCTRTSNDTTPLTVSMASDILLRHVAISHFRNTFESPSAPYLMMTITTHYTKILN